MRLSEIKDDRALDVLAEIIEPAADIVADAECKRLYEESKVKCAAYAIKNHKDAVKAILAAMEGVPAEEYHCNVFTLPMRLLEILNDPEMEMLFT